MRLRRRSRAFTLVELIAVIVVLAILAGVAVPRYFDYQLNARTAALEGILGSVRTGIAHFALNQAATGTARYPTWQELCGNNTVMAGNDSLGTNDWANNNLPRNPFSGGKGMFWVGGYTGGGPPASPVTVSLTDGRGWCYYTDSNTTPTVYWFSSSVAVPTSRPKPGGGVFLSNEL